MSALNTLIEQEFFHVPSFTLECGAELHNVPIAYKTWGTLNETRDNVMVICHAFTGSADVTDWWGPLMGPGKAFDPRRWFIFCANVLGSPYGTASPITINPDTGVKYGPDFPPTSIRDDVRLHKHVLDHLGVSSIGVVIGGSMGGMAVLEWPLCSLPGYVKHIIPLATSAKHSAWCISWGEAQRQSIYADPGYQDGYYESQPATGLAAARMAALLTYRCRDSFEKRFGRKAQVKKEGTGTGTGTGVGDGASGRKGIPTPPGSPKIVAKEDARFAHNDGHRNSLSSRVSSPEPPAAAAAASEPSSRPNIFSAQSYLRYQGDKFTARFDANCYIHITRKLDTHDISRDRRRIISSDENRDEEEEEESESSALPRILSTLPPRALVISISTDGLFTPSEQKEIASHIPQSELVTIQSPDGHDGFLLEFEQINGHVMRFLRREFPELYQGGGSSSGGDGNEMQVGDFEIKKTSVFGEAEADIAQW